MLHHFIKCISQSCRACYNLGLREYDVYMLFALVYFVIYRVISRQHVCVCLCARMLYMRTLMSTLVCTHIAHAC